MAIEESFAERARRKRREARVTWTVEDEQQWLSAHPDDEPVLDLGEKTDWSQYVPDFEEDISPESLEVDNFLSHVDIIDAYNRWTGKGQVSNPGRKTEGIMIRCPNPTHPDHNPSAWINTDKQVYSCGGCGMEGGDIFVIAAYSFGYPVPIPRQRFPELKKQMAESLGYQIKQVGSKKYVQPIPKTSEPEEDAAEDAPLPRERAPFPRERRNSDEEQDDENDKTEQIATVTPIHPPVEDDGRGMPDLNWRPMVHDGTFLDQWMRDTTTDHLPEEYYFWLGLAAIGLAVKDRAVLTDMPPVKGNLFLCLTGVTGVGKTRSTQKFEQLLREAVPEGTEGNGVKILPVPSSGESLIDCFDDPYTVEVEQPDGSYTDIIKHHKIAGMIDFGELSVLIGRSSRLGSTMKPLLLQFFDAYGNVTNVSRTQGKAEARSPYATVIATTQPGSIRTLLIENDSESGFLNRWIFIGGEPDRPKAFQKDYFDPKPSAEKLRAIASRYTTIPEDEPPRYHEVEQDADDYFEQYFQDIIWPMKVTEGNDLYTRGDLMIKKFAFLLMLDRELKAVDVECFKNAITLWEYMEKMYNRIGASIGIGPFDHCKAKIREKLIEFHEHYGHGPKPKQFISMMNRDTRFSSELIEKVLQSMIRLGEVEEISKQDQTGNVTVRYENADMSS